MTVTHTGHTRFTGWTVRLAVASGQSVVNLWNGVSTDRAGTVSVHNVGYNGVTEVAGTQVFGFVASGNGSPPVVLSCTGS